MTDGSAGEQAPTPLGDRRWVRTALMVAVVVLLAGAVAVAAVKANRRSSARVKYTELRPGDCLQKPDDTFVRAERVACAKDHDLEVFALVDDPAPQGARYPGREILEREANVACPPQFQFYVGVPFDQSSLLGQFYVPTKANWESGNRRLLCTVSARTGKLKGSVKGSAR